MKLGKYVDLFLESGYDDMITIETMSEEELIDIGIEKRGHRKKILIFIQKYKEANNGQLNEPVIDVNDDGNIEGLNIFDTVQ